LVVVGVGVAVVGEVADVGFVKRSADVLFPMLITPVPTPT